MPDRQDSSQPIEMEPTRYSVGAILRLTAFVAIIAGAFPTLWLPIVMPLCAAPIVALLLAPLASIFLRNRPLRNAIAASFWIAGAAFGYKVSGEPPEPGFTPPSPAVAVVLGSLIGGGWWHLVLLPLGSWFIHTRTDSLRSTEEATDCSLD
jgi:hypothetical protein